MEMLRNKLILEQVGATMLTGLTGNVPIVFSSKYQGNGWKRVPSRTSKLTFTSSTMKPKASIQGVYSNQL
ncbi:MAG: hypothetical protein ACLTZT_00235 [Butyricimonas faecalis]